MNDASGTKGANHNPVVRIGGLHGRCPILSRAIMTLRHIGLTVPRKRVYYVCNRSKSNGSALLGRLTNVRGPAGNNMHVANIPVDELSRQRLTRFERGRLNFIFRSCGLLPGLGTVRGITVPLVFQNIPGHGHRAVTHTVLGQINLNGHVGRCPARVSNNRRRHINVTHTFIAHPRIMFTSRPANGLSSGAGARIVSVVYSFTHSFGRAVILIARSSGVTRCTSHVIALLSNHVVNSQLAWRS